MKKIIALSFFCLFLSSTFAEGFNTSVKKNAPQKIRKRNARPDIPGTLLIEFGLNILQDNAESMDVELLGSRTINFIYLYDIQIGSSKFSFLPGIGVGLDRYKFDEDITITRNADGTSSTVAVPGGGVKKSMLVTNYLEIPLEFRFHSNPNDKKRSFKLGLGFKAGLLFNAHTKIKQEIDGETTKVKVHDDFALNRFRYGVTGRIGIGGFNVFVYQNMNELFEDGKGPEATSTSNLTVGVSFTGF